jgi:hypothetical protein
MMLIDVCIAAGTHQSFLNSPTKSPFSYRSISNGPGVGLGDGGADGDPPVDADGDAVAPGIVVAPGVLTGTADGGRLGTTCEARGSTCAHGVTTGAAAMETWPKVRVAA